MAEELEEVVVTARRINPPLRTPKVIKFPSGDWHQTQDNTNESSQYRGRPYVIFNIFEIERDPATGLPNVTAYEGTTPGPTGTVGQEAIRQGIDQTFDLLNTDLGRAFAGAAIGTYFGAGTGTTAAIVADAALGAPVGRTVTSAVDELLGKAFGTGAGLGTTIQQNLKNLSTRRNVDKLADYIVLPVPDNIAISYDHQYQEIGLTNALGLVGMLAQANKTRTGGQGGAALGTTDPYVMELASGVASKIPTIGTGAEKVLLFGTTGLAVNPQLEMIFTSTALRKFMLDFTLTPKNAADTKALQEVISKLRYYSAPDIPETLSGRYFIPPAQFSVTFFKGDDEKNSNFFKTKKCVLQSISVDFTPNGYSTHADGSPTQVKLQLVFIETSLLSRKDYDNNIDGYK